MLSLGLLALAGCASVPSPTPPADAAPDRADVSLDRYDFIAALPVRVYVACQHEESPAAKAQLSAGLKALGAVAERFVALPPGSVQPHAIRQVKPEYPADLRSARVQGFARFVMLISTDGKVQALHCYEQSHPLFAESAAAALRQWQFTPAQVNGAPVRVLTEQTVGFALP